MAKKRKVTRDYIDNPDVISKRVVKKSKKGKTTIKEKADTLSEREYLNPGQTKYIKHDRQPYKYNDKKLWKRRFKSKVDEEGTEIKRKEKIVYDEGKQMKKRKQKKIRFGKNKGKIKVKTVHYNKGKKTKNVEYKDKTDKSKLKKGGVVYRDGGFLEPPTEKI